MGDGINGVGDIAKDFVKQIGDLPKEIVADVSDQVMGTDSNQKDVEQGQSDGNSQTGGTKSQNDLATQARTEELRMRLKSMIEGEIEQHHQVRMDNQKQRDEDWEVRMVQDEQREQEERAKAQDRVAQMIYQERAGSGETGKRKG